MTNAATVGLRTRHDTYGEHVTNPLTEQQFETLNALNLSIAQIADALGSESTNPGLVFLTRLPDLAAAVGELMPGTYRLIALDVADLLTKYIPAGDRRRDILRSLLAQDPTGGAAGLCGGEFFRPDAPDRGSFHVVVFLRVAEIAGFNMLVAFSRAET
ncbi:MAG TPA: hypothetical protein VLM79_31540 [Kofleriaceae bacterium]|nr:hypothetical protein [Kofleriaceae bacterium]